LLSNANLCPPPSLDAFMIDRALGAFIGLAIGDAVGTTTEDTPPDPARINSDPDEGQLNPRLVRWTAPTAMALALADTLLDPAGYSSHGLMTRLVQWHQTGRFASQGRCVAVGRSTHAAISRFVATGTTQFAPDPVAAAGSGSLSRLAPVALRFLHHPALAEQIARQQSYCTHAAPEAADACANLVALLRHLILRTPGTAPARSAALNIADMGLGHFVSHRRRFTGQVSDTLQLALWSVRQADDFDQAVASATGIGGDAASVGAVTGMLAGARYGYSSIPNRWLNRLAWRNRIRAVGYQLLGAASC
jgi:ADP-ribosyl-[dinitrogen reductase] hydrolase